MQISFSSMHLSQTPFSMLMHLFFEFLHLMQALEILFFGCRWLAMMSLTRVRLSGASMFLCDVIQSI